jgi:DNA-binding LacI/PurR family transcriptional regulator
MKRPTTQQIRELAAAAICDDRTIRKAYAEPSRVKAASLERVIRAAQTLGIEPPARPQRSVV